MLVPASTKREPMVVPGTAMPYSFSTTPSAPVGATGTTPRYQLLETAFLLTSRVVALSLSQRMPGAWECFFRKCADATGMWSLVLNFVNFVIPQAWTKLPVFSCQIPRAWTY
eukprot:1524125-Rhodomonas_salina.1